MRGKLVVAEGLDLSGKGLFLDAMIERAKEKGLRIYDAHPYWEQHDHHPPVSDVIASGADIVYLSEPTSCLIGRTIRRELTSKSAKDAGRSYSSVATAYAYALDRQILIERLEAPLRDAGVHILKSRNVLSSLVYQGIQGQHEPGSLTHEEIQHLRGNAMALSHAHAPTEILILAPPAEVIMERMSRAKKDDCIFERLDFQRRIREVYTGVYVKKLCRVMGSAISYPQSDVSEEHTRSQAYAAFDRIFAGVAPRGNA